MISAPPSTPVEHPGAAKPPPKSIITRRYALPRLVGEWLCWLASFLILILMPRKLHLLGNVVGWSAILLRASVRPKGPQRATLELLRPDVGIPVVMFQLALIAMLSSAGRSWTQGYHDIFFWSFIGLFFSWLLWLDIRHYMELPAQPNSAVIARPIKPSLVTRPRTSFLFIVAWLLIGISACAAVVSNVGIFAVALFCTALFFRPSRQDNPAQKVSSMELCLVAAFFLLAVVLAPLREAEFWRNARFASFTCVIPIVLLLWPLWLDIPFPPAFPVDSSEGLSEFGECLRRRLRSFLRSTLANSGGPAFFRGPLRITCLLKSKSHPSANRSPAGCFPPGTRTMGMQWRLGRRC
jgi:hypothetical protein